VRVQEKPLGTISSSGFVFGKDPIPTTSFVFSSSSTEVIDRLIDRLSVYVLLKCNYWCMCAGW
jgi:hypothetical protein